MFYSSGEAEIDREGSAPSVLSWNTLMNGSMEGQKVRKERNILPADMELDEKH